MDRLKRRDKLCGLAMFKKMDRVAFSSYAVDGYDSADPSRIVVNEDGNLMCVDPKFAKSGKRKANSNFTRLEDDDYLPSAQVLYDDSPNGASSGGDCCGGFGQ